MKRFFLFLIIASFAFGAPLLGQPDMYPFKVKIGGKEAVKKSPNALFATIEGTVTPDSDVEVAAQGQVIANMFPSDAQGKPQTGAAPTVLIFTAPKTSLAKTIGGKKLAPGTYLANVVAGGATSRVMFTVK